MFWFPTDRNTRVIRESGPQNSWPWPNPNDTAQRRLDIIMPYLEAHQDESWVRHLLDRLAESDQQEPTP